MDKRQAIESAKSDFQRGYRAKAAKTLLAVGYHANQIEAVFETFLAEPAQVPLSHPPPSPRQESPRVFNPKDWKLPDDYIGVACFYYMGEYFVAQDLPETLRLALREKMRRERIGPTGPTRRGYGRREW